MMQVPIPRDTPLHIGILKLSAIGDTVMTVPLIKALQKHFPQARITWITTPVIAALFKGLTGVTFLVINKPDGIRAYLAARKQLCTQHFDVVLAAQTSLRTNLLLPCIQAKQKIGLPQPIARDGHRFFVDTQLPFEKNHAVEMYLQFARHLGAEDVSVQFEIPITDKDKQYSAKQLPTDQPTIGINPYSSITHKNWSVESYSALIERLLKKQTHHICITGGPDHCEHQFIQRVVHALPAAQRAQIRVLAGPTAPTLKQLAALYQHPQVTCIISPDTGPLHIANAVGATCVGLYAGTNPMQCGPYGQLDHCINAYPRVAEKLFHTHIDALPYKMKLYHPDTMRQITVDEVLKKLESTLKTSSCGTTCHDDP